MDFLAEPEIGHAICQCIADLRIEQARRLAALGVDVLRLGDDVCTQKGSLMSLDTYRTFLKEPTRAIIQAAKQINPDLLVFMHCDGRVGDMVEEYVDIGVDILNPVQPECNDLERSPGDPAAACPSGAASARKAPCRSARPATWPPRWLGRNRCSAPTAACCSPPPISSNPKFLGKTSWPLSRRPRNSFYRLGRTNDEIANDPPRARPQRAEPNRLRPHPRQTRRNARGQQDAHGAFRPLEHGAVAPRAGRRLPLRRAGLLRAGAADVSRRQHRGLFRRALPLRRVRGRADTSKPATCPMPASTGWKTSTAPISPAPTGSTTRRSAQQAERLREQGFAVCCGTAGDMDFINSIARAAAWKQVLMDLIDDNPVYLEIMQARFEFYYHMHRRMLEAADGLIDFTHVGDDLGNQRGPMIGLAIFEKHFAPKYEKYFEMVHDHGAKTMMHICGCAERFLPRLTEIGLDVYDVVQPTTPQMDIAVLQKKVGDRLTFCGSVCVQTTMAWGTVEDVEARSPPPPRSLPQGGLFLGPTHAIQVGSPLENILALYRTAGSLAEKIDESILSIAADGSDPDKISLSKLF